MLAALLAALLTQADPIAACERRLLPYEGWTETPDTVWSLDLPAASGGRLVYLGAEHSRDPAHEQFARIEAAFVESQPTVVFYEGPDRGVGAAAADTIATRGESGYVRLLAASTGATVRGLEPGPIDLIRDLTASHPTDQVFLFFILREVARMRDREGLSGAALDVAAARLIERAAGMAESAGIAAPFSDLAGLEAAYTHYWPATDWRAVAPAWFDPMADDARTGGRFMAALNRASSAARNRHMYRLLAETTRSGERVFAVVGRNHVPMQAEALRCALDAGA